MPNEGSTRNFLAEDAPFNIDIAPSSSMTINVEITNSAVEEWNGTYNDIPAVPMPNTTDRYMFGAPIIADTASEQLLDFSQYPFSIMGFYDSAYNKNIWMLNVPDPKYFSLSTTKYDIKVTTNVKTVTVSDDFKEIVKAASGGVMSGVMLVAPYNDNFTATDLPSEAGAYHTTSFPVTTDESEARGGNYILYRQNPSTGGYDIALIAGANNIWCPVDDILLITASGRGSNIIGLGSIPVNAASRPLSMNITFITNGETSVRLRVKVLVNNHLTNNNADIHHSSH